MIGRRDFITLLGGAAVPSILWPVAPLAQQPDRMRQVGVLLNGVATDRQLQSYVAAFEQVLRNLGWKKGQNLRIEYRWNAGDAERTRVYAAELIGPPTEVIVTASTLVLTTVQQATRSIPIIFTSVSDPVVQGFVTNLAHPGGNTTGFSPYEFSIGAKWLDLLKRMVPALARTGLMFNPANALQVKFFQASIEAAAPALGVEAVALPVHEKADIETAIATLSRQPNGGLVVPTDQFLTIHRDYVVEIAARYRVPAVYAQQEYVNVGGLISYGVVTADQWRGAAFYVDRVLKGANPGDLPVQLSTKFELAVNLRAASALGLEVPMNLMLIVDQVVE
jgi:putative ABC transport system substrate-binding protein